MGSVKRLAEEVRSELSNALPKLRKTVVRKNGSTEVGVSRECDECVAGLRIAFAIEICHWCVCVGRTNDASRLTLLEKTREQVDPEHWSFKKLYCSLVSLFKRLMHCLQNDLALASICCYSALILPLIWLLFFQ